MKRLAMNYGMLRRGTTIFCNRSLLTLAMMLASAAGATATELGIKDTQFTLNGKPTFLLGISYYGALGASEEFIRRDLDDMQRYGFNWIRVFATWDSFGNDVSAVNGEGKPREPFLGKLKWLLAECDRRGVVVDVSLIRRVGKGSTEGLKTYDAHRRAVETLVAALKPQRNWYLDLANEHTAPYAFVSFEEVRQLRDAAKQLDAQRLVTASSGEISRDELRAYLRTVELDFVCPHRPRHPQSLRQAEAKTREYLAWMREIGRVVPVHYQEPLRRGYFESWRKPPWQPTAEAFLTDLSQVQAGGAAGWCFHNGDQDGKADGKPRRSFDLREQRLFDQLDEEERKVLAGLPTPGALPDQLALEISHQPTNRDNCALRYHVMMQLGQLVHASLGQGKLEQALPSQRAQEIRQKLDAEKEDGDEVYRMLDESLLKLCQAGRESPLIQRLRRVIFPSPTGQQVVGYLVSPATPSDRAFVFGHGGFGHKEMWLDLMLALADQTGSYALTMDFEGTGESSGYCTWSGRIGDFSGAVDYLEKEWGVRRFSVGGHSGGGAWPAACAAIKDPRISAVVLWDCIFDFYDTHVGPEATDPGGNPAALLDATSLESRGKRLVPTEVAGFRHVEANLDAIYEDIEKTMGQYRNTAELLGQAQKQRRLAVLHIVAEDVTRPIRKPQVLEFTVNRPESASPVRRRFLNRPLRFTVSGLFGQRYKAWEAQLGQPSRTVLIPNTTHAFEKPGRDLGVKNTVEWLNGHLQAEIPNTEPFLGFGQRAGTGSQPAATGAVEPVGLKVGVAKAVITPRVSEADRPVWLAGFSPGRRATGVHDDLYARALFLESGKQRLVIVALDFVGYDYTEVLACRALLKTRQPELADVHLLIASTHNHEGPDTLGPWGPLPMVSGVDRAYLDQVRDKIVDVVAAAARSAASARLRFAEAPTPGLIGDSRPPKVINDTIHAMHAERADNGQPIGSLLLWHSHPEDLGSKNTLITADFPKYAIEEMEAALGGTTVYLSGTVGGLLSPSHVRLTDERSGEEIPRRTFAHAEAIGRRAARIAVAAIQQTQPLIVERLDLKVKELDLPLGNPAYRVGLALRSVTPRPLYSNGKRDPRTELLAERVQRDPMLRAWMDQARERLGVAVSLLQQLALPIGEDIRTELNVITLGPAQFITIPGELYPELAIGGIPNPPDPSVDFPDAPPEPALTKLMHGEYKFIIGLANDELGYLLPKSQWDVQAPYAYGSTKPPYGEVFSPGPDAAPRIAEANRELLAGQKKAGWMLLFDGQTLDGWKASEDPASFTVRDGMIVAHAVGTAIKGQAPHPKSHLFYVGPDGHASFTDFEFQADVMTEPESNSGVYFHTQFIENDWPQKGFEVQINSYKNEKRKTGGLYKVVDITEALVPNNEWFRLHVIVRGKRVIIQLNGKTAVDWTEPEGFVVRDPPWFSERKLSSGTFALQAHDPKSTVYFKNIRVKLLDKPPATDPAQQGGDITNGLVSHWTMDEGTGKVAKDRISGNHGVFEKGEPAWVKGRIGDGELEFTESCFLNCGKHESLNMTKAMTFAAWIKKAKDGRKSRIASRHGFIKEQGEQPGNAGWLVLCGGPQKVNIEWGLSTTGEDWHTGFTTPNSFPYGQWNHLAVTYDGAVMRAYINGVEDTGGDFPRKVGGSIHVSSAEMLLGQDRAYGPKFGGPKTWSFTGTIDDARLYNRALSAEDVRALFAQGEQPSNKPALEETWVNPPKEVIPGVEHRSFHSASMLRGVGYNIYLPPGYSQATDRRYPVIYHLHGFGNTESHHLRNITILDEAIRKGDVPPVILVYAFGGRTSFYADSPDKTVMSETCIVKELIPHVDKTYRTIAAREGRAIHGWSMGGSGALKFAFKHPELFGSAVAYGPGMTDSDTMKAKYSAVLHKMFAGDVRRYEEEAFWTWMRKNADRARGQVAVRVVVGTKDVSLGDSRKIHALLGELNFPHDYEEVPDVPHDPMKLYPLAGLRSFQFSAQQFK